MQSGRQAIDTAGTAGSLGQIDVFQIQDDSSRVWRPQALALIGSHWLATHLQAAQQAEGSRPCESCFMAHPAQVGHVMELESSQPDVQQVAM